MGSVEYSYKLTHMEMAVLLLHFHAASYLPESVGFEDAENSFEYMAKILNADTRILKKSILESALWSANLMDEHGYFWHPRGESFDTFAHRIISRHLPGNKKKTVKFDRFYNLITQGE